MIDIIPKIDIPKVDDMPYGFDYNEVADFAEEQRNREEARKLYRGVRMLENCLGMIHVLQAVRESGCCGERLHARICGILEKVE